MTNNPTTGWTDWSSTPSQNQSQKLEDRVARLEKWSRTHLGIDFAASGIDYPHPSQKVKVLFFFDGNGRLNEDGFQFLAFDTPINGLAWVQEYTETPRTVYPASNIYGYLGDSTPTEFFANLVIESQADTGDKASIIVGASNESFTTSSVLLSAEGGGETASLFLYVNPNASAREVSIANAPLTLAVETSDFSALSDGMLWYRSDLDRFRARANGVTENLAYESDIPTSSNVQPYAAKTTTYTTTNADGVISVDATSASFTVTLVTAVGNSGLTQTFKKINATNVVTIDANSTQTIDGVLTIGLSRQWESVTLVSNGTNWLITGWY